MTNAEVAALLEEMAILLEVEGGDPFRIRAYQRASRSVAAYSRPVAGLSPKELLEIPGVGKGIAQHLREIAASGTFKELAALKARFPQGLQELMRVPGLGPKRARFLFEEAGVKDVDALRDAARKGRLRGLRGFGAKTEQNVLKGLEFAGQARRVLRSEAVQVAAELCAGLKAVRGVREAQAAGSLRRGRETVGDVDILAAAEDWRPVLDAFTRHPRVRRVLAAGDTKASVLLLGGLQCDLRVVPPESYGAALQYFTGSKDHNVALRERALKRGLTINEYGVFKLSDKKRARPVAGRTEEEVYEALGLAFIPPELRENRGEIEAAASGSLPRLVELKDVRGDFHNHSTHSDGRHGLEEMARAARDMGWEWVALGDHSQSLGVANGLSVPRLRATMLELDGIRSRVKGIALLRSMEVDVLQDGALDYPDDVLDEIDVVVASVHSRFKQPGPEMTARIARAAANPRVDILGHLSGRLINKRPPYEFDAEAVLRAAAGAGTAVEVNGQPERQDVDDARARRARELGAPIALNTDAHSIHEFRHMETAVTIARRAWLTPKDVLNCLPLAELKGWLRNHLTRA